MKSFKKQPLVKTGLIFFLLTMCSPVMHAQRHEIGVRLGMSNLVGDIGRTGYILQKPFGTRISDYGIPFYGGLMYRMNFNPYQTLRFDAGYAFVQFDDTRAKEQYRINRGWAGTNSAFTADALFEYNFYPVNNEQKGMLSPYVFGGIGAMLTNTMKITFVNDFNRANGQAVAPTTEDDFVTTAERQSANTMTIAIPFGAGLKYKFNYNWALSGEMMFRPTFSDGIDYSVIGSKDYRLTYNKDILQADNNKSILQQEPYVAVAKQRAADYLNDRNVGNPHSKDWVNSITLTLSYSFGRPPCYCE